MKSLFLTVLMGCSPLSSPAVLSVAATTEAEPSPAFVADAEHMSRDWQVAVHTLEQLATHLEHLPDAERSELRAAVRELATNCPYTRASFMVPMALKREIDNVDRSTLPQAAHEDFDRLTRGISTHFRVIKAMGADELPLPTSSDYLSNVEFGLVDREGFANAGDATELTHHLMAAVPDLVEAMPAQTTARIEAAQAVLTVHLGSDNTLYGAMASWNQTAIATVTLAAEDKQYNTIGRVTALISAVLGNSC